jgi:hypothetical protein
MIPPLDHLDDEDRAKVEAWDWAAINAADRVAMAKAATMPKCMACGGAMWFGQESRHFSCTGRPGAAGTGR